MLHEKSPRAIFMVWAIVVVLLAPLFILFMPLVITQTFFYDPEQIVVLAPAKNHGLITWSFGLVFAILVMLALKRNKWTYLMTGVLTLASVATFALSTLSYVAIHPEHITIQNYTEKNRYDMDEFTKVIYEYGVSERGRYQFITKTGEAVYIEDSPQLEFEKRSKIYRTALAHDLEFVERPYEGE